MPERDDDPACIYVRLSRAPDGSREKVERQEADSRAMATRLGWPVGRVYCDNNLSAWRRDVRRADWEEMIAAVEAGLWRRMIVWHGDRLIRQPYDLEVLLRLAEERELQLASVAGVRDLGNPDDQFVLRIEAAAACRESANTSRRVKRGKRASAQHGKPKTGRYRLFGYAPGGSVLVPGEVEELKQIRERLLAGESMHGIVADLTARAVPTVAGGLWRTTTLRAVLTNPYLAGLSVYRGEVIAGGTWPAVFTEAEWREMCAVLAGRAAEHGPRSAPRDRVYLLSGIARCGSCDGPLYVHRLHDGLKYLCRSRGRTVCPGPRVCRSMTPVDEYVISGVLGRLSGGKVDPAPAPADRAGDAQVELAGVTARLAEIEAELTRPGAGQPVALLARSAAALEARAVQLRQQLAVVPRRPRDNARGLDRPGWDALTLDRRRALVRDLYRVVLLPTRRGRRGFDESSVWLDPR